MSRLLILLIFFISSGCGYTTSGSLYAGRKIIIKPVVNKIDITTANRNTAGYETFPILIENKLTNEIINKFNIDGQLKVVSQDPQAFQLSCIINDYTKEALRYEDDADIREQRLRLYVHMKLIAPDGEVLNERDIVGEEDYFLSGANARSESAAQIDLVDDAARRISEAVLEQW